VLVVVSDWFLGCGWIGWWNVAGLGWCWCRWGGCGFFVMGVLGYWCSLVFSLFLVLVGRAWFVSLVRVVVVVGWVGAGLFVVEFPSVGCADDVSLSSESLQVFVGCSPGNLVCFRYVVSGSVVCGCECGDDVSVYFVEMVVGVFCDVYLVVRCVNEECFFWFDVELFCDLVWDADDALSADCACFDCCSVWVCSVEYFVDCAASFFLCYVCF
jgi:hypothetical protein